ncbi:dihydroxyacetone kinase-like protein [Trueperella bonasi]|uniref:Dihydroxyacetone kinase-like protein n=1 Tax=Trueperella bonasi TaxID=312286 RepID=A0ABT9NHP1_9ACTO|nr:DAK2 domain-containing protein [Trueperella bonasi]MDP9806921.1 dihydroxyacetone kinase-like protein [Trueperella bonasi]
MKAWVIAWLARSRELISENRELLNELDRAIGDGDHGEALDRAFSMISLNGSYASGADVLRQVALGLRMNLPGAGGEILAGSYQRMADVLALADDTLSEDDDDVVPVPSIGNGEADVFAAMIEAGRVAAEDLGGAAEGDKTFVDAWAPAAREARAAANAGKQMCEVALAASEAARGGCEATVDMVARKGRAAFLGEKSAGHMDAGAKSVSLILRAAAEIS